MYSVNNLILPVSRFVVGSLIRFSMTNPFQNRAIPKTSNPYVEPGMAVLILIGPFLSWEFGPTLSGASQPGLPDGHIGGACCGAVQSANTERVETPMINPKTTSVIEKMCFFMIIYNLN